MNSGEGIGLWLIILGLAAFIALYIFVRRHGNGDYG